MLPLNVDGIITFSFLPLWTLAGIAGEALHEKLIQIDDILIRPNAATGAHLKLGYKQYALIIEHKSIEKAIKMTLNKFTRLFYRPDRQ
jgi:hypothetical protein